MERRYFKGVQNQKGQKGEIFGLDNLLTFYGDDIFLRDIVNKTNVAEAKKGVHMVELNIEDALNDEDDPLRVDDDDENGAMSQLAALLTEGDTAKEKKKPRPKTDAIQAILAGAGVEYTHDNSEVVGSSRVEAHLSRQAEEIGNEAGVGEERLFAESQSTLEPGQIAYVYHPPEDVMMRQFCTMAKMFGFANAVEFALVVEGWTQKQRTDCLERFYLKRKERLADMEAPIALPASDKAPVLDSSMETDDDDDDEL